MTTDDPTQEFRFAAYSSSQRFNLREYQELFASKQTKLHEQHCLICTLGPERYLYLFRFGTAVFFNIPADETTALLEKLKLPATRPLLEEKCWLRDISADDCMLRIAPGPIRVAFDGVTAPTLQPGLLLLIAQVLAQSSALELLEWEVEDFLEQSERSLAPLRKRGDLSGGRRQLLRFLGKGLGTRHRIVKHLALLSTPDVSWDVEELYVCYTELVESFEVEERIETIEKMMQLTSDAGELLLEISHIRRAELLEIIIILLIAFEIIEVLFV